MVAEYMNTKVNPKKTAKKEEMVSSLMQKYITCFSKLISEFSKASFPYLINVCHDCNLERIELVDARE